MSTNNKISNLISTQAPFFVRNDHANFVRFIEAYYEYLEQSNTVTGIGKTIDIAKSLESYIDIDRTVDLFAEKFYDTYLALIPKNIAADRTLLIKHIKDFYTARGTEKSIEFLFRAMFGDDPIEFYYPKRDILRASDGKWFVEKSIKINDIAIDGVANNDINIAQKFTQRQVRGNSSTATAIVERVDVFYESGTLVNELKISQQTKNFTNGEVLYATFIDDAGVTHSITANLFSGLLNTAEVLYGGFGYSVGDIVQVESNTGQNGVVAVASVTTGNISGITVLNGGAGFQVNNAILVSGGGGSNARANVLTVDTSELYHPNTYNVAYSTISPLANITLNSANYAAFSSSIQNGANANTTVANTILTFKYANTGPIQTVLLLNAGKNYTSVPSTSVVANTRINNLGVLGRMKINAGGVGYGVNDEIQIINVIGGYGAGARANVKTVNATGSITEVQFIDSSIAGYPIGGMGYSQFKLPIANVVSANTNATGANIAVTAILGAGENLPAGTSSIGTINRLVILNRGSNYITAPTLNLKSIGDGTAQAVATIITGAYEYPGRFLNDDGHLSGYNFLEDRDYYQEFSYVIKARKSIEKYRKTLKDLVHPSGLKLFGEYTYVDNGETLNVSATTANGSYNANLSFAGTYVANGNSLTTFVNVSIKNTNTLNIANLSRVYVEFISGDTANLVNGVYSVVSANSSTFQISLTKANIASITIANTGTGYSNGLIRFAGGSGRNANASYTVNTINRGIETITLSNRGSSYVLGEKVYALGTGGINANLQVTLQPTTSVAISNVSGNLIFSSI